MPMPEKLPKSFSRPEQSGFQFRPIKTDSRFFAPSIIIRRSEIAGLVYVSKGSGVFEFPRGC